MLTLKTLKSPKGAHKNIKRIGRGQGSGQGTQAGKGHKGQKARKSGHVKSGFEGGQMPLYRRLPKRGFVNAPFKVEYAVVNLTQIENLGEDTVSREVLVSHGLISGQKKAWPIKVLGTGEISRKVNFVHIDKFSKTAEEKILKAGGKIQPKEGK